MHHISLHKQTRPDKAAYIPCECTANAQIKFLSCIHCQGFIAIRFTQALHSIAYVCVSDRTEFCTKNTLLPGISFVHYWLNDIQYLLGKRNYLQLLLNDIWSKKQKQTFLDCVFKKLFFSKCVYILCNCDLTLITSKQMFSPSLSQSSHNTT